MYKSLYPSIIMENNIAPNTQIGRIDIPKKVYPHENTYQIDKDKYSRSGEFIENMVTDNTIEFGKRWFNLAGISEMIDDIDEYFDQMNLGKYSELDSNPRSPIIPTIKSGVEEPIEFTGKKVDPPVLFYNDKPDINTDNEDNNKKG